MPRSYIFIGIDNKQLYCATGSRQGKKIHINHTAEHSLKNQEEINSIIFNPSALQQIVASFIESAHLTNPNIVICLPHQAHSKSNLSLLQNALCFSKNGLIISSIIQTDFDLFTKQCTQSPTDTCPKPQQLIKENRLNKLIPEHYHSLPKWIAGFAASLLMLITVGTTSYFHTHNELKASVKQMEAIQVNIKKLQPKVLAVQELEKKHTLLKQHYNNNPTSNTHTIPALLVTLAQTIPTHSWLTQFSIKSENRKNPSIIDVPYNDKKNHYVIKGISSQPDTITTWLNNLITHQEEMDFFLISIDKTQTQQQSALQHHYAFTIQANA